MVDIPAGARLPHSKRVAFILFVIAWISAAARAQEKIEVSDDPLHSAQKMPPTPHADRGVVIHVQDAGGRPLVGASLIAVIGIDSKDEKLVDRVKRAAATKHSEDFEKMQMAIFEGIGVRFVTNERGEAKIPSLGSRDAILALSGDMRLLVKGSQAAGKRFVRVTMRPPRTVHVRVLDRRGRPVKGIPVGVGTVGSRNSQLFDRPRTDENGNAEIEPRQLLAHDLRRLSIHADFASTHPIQKAFDLHATENDAKTPIEIRVPDFGQVRVYMTDEDNRPIAGLEEARLIVQDGNRRFVRAYPADRVEGDSATFRFVELESRVELRCEFRGSGHPLETSCQGPRHHMDTRIVSIKVPNLIRPLSCRLLGVDGSPIIRERVGLIFVTERGTIGQTATTDGTGAMRVLVPEGTYRAKDGLLFIVRDKGPSSGAKRIPFALVRRRRNSLGEQRLESLRTITAGRVVDSAGKPIAGAVVTAANIYGKFEYIDSDGRDEIFKCRAVSDENGRFRLAAAPTDELPHALAVDKQGYVVTDGSRLRRGNENVTVVLTATSVMHGKVSGLPDHLAPINVKLRVYRPGAEKPKAIPVRSDGRFSIEGCLPGEYSIEMRLGNAGAQRTIPIHGIVVAAGVPCRDPRLQVDVSKHYRFVRLTIVDPAGSPIPFARAEVHHTFPGGAGVVESRADSKGVCDLAFRAASAKVSVFHPEYRRRELESVTRSRVVNLEKAIRVNLTVRNMPKLPANLYYRVQIRPRIANPKGPGSDQPGFSIQSSIRDAQHLDHGKITAFLTEPGDYSLVLTPFAAKRNRMPERLGRGQLTLDFTLKAPADETAADPDIELTLAPAGAALVRRLIDSLHGPRPNWR